MKSKFTTMPPDVVEATDRDESERFFDDSFRWKDETSSVALDERVTTHGNSSGADKDARQKLAPFEENNSADERRRQVLEAMMQLAAENAVNSVGSGHLAATRAAAEKQAKPSGMTHGELKVALWTALSAVLALSLSFCRSWFSDVVFNFELIGFKVVQIGRGVLVLVIASIVTDLGEAYFPLDEYKVDGPTQGQASRTGKVSQARKMV